MSKFNEGQRVVVVDENNDLKYGSIETLYETAKIAIVKFDDGNVGKVHFSDLAIVRQSEPVKEVEPEKPTEPVEKSEITITPDEFKKIASKMIAEKVKEMGENGGLLGLAFTLFVAEIHRALFYDAVEND